MPYTFGIEILIFYLYLHKLLINTKLNHNQTQNL